jgi:DNA-binding MarR family transcriptional regulator
MSAMDTAALAVAATTVIGSFIGSVRWLVKHYLAELKPNSGSSMRDQINLLEARVETILRILEK